MELYKLLDRFELLYSHDSRLADLRRAYIDQDLSSIFKLSTDNENYRKAILDENIYSIFRLIGDRNIFGNIEDLRKAVVEQNLYSLFKLIPDSDDLRKAVLDKNIHSIFRLLNNDELKKLVIYDNRWAAYSLLTKYTSSYFPEVFKYFWMNNINYDEDCFSRGQLLSKKWLVEEIKKLNLELGIVFLCAGWYGTLATMLFENNLKLEKIRCFDIDSTTEEIAEIFNRPWVIDGWKFKAVIEDIHNINFLEHKYTVNKYEGGTETLYDRPDTIINTSCEHIENFDEWYNKIPFHKLVVLQCNNYFEIEEHVNAKETLEEFKKQTPLTVELYSGELDLGKYKRFMRIGYR